MALIRTVRAGPMACDPVALDFGDLEREAQECRRRACAEAEGIVAAAKAERERLMKGAEDEARRAGHAKGFEEGRADGRERGRQEALAEGQARLKELDAAWKEALDRFVVEREGMLAEARLMVLKLAIAASAAVTKRAVGIDPEIAVAQVEAVLAVLARPTRLVVHVHPDDEPLVREALPAMRGRLPAAEHAELRTDAGLERGSCVARMGSPSEAAGLIDASVRVQLERIAESLLPGAGAAVIGSMMNGGAADDASPGQRKEAA